MMYEEKLKQIRQERGLTQAQMAKLLNTTQQHYARYENGKADIPAARLKEICNILKISADWLLGLTDDNDE